MSAKAAVHHERMVQATHFSPFSPTPTRSRATAEPMSAQPESPCNALRLSSLSVREKVREAYRECANAPAAHGAILSLPTRCSCAFPRASCQRPPHRRAAPPSTSLRKCHPRMLRSQVRKGNSSSRRQDIGRVASGAIAAPHGDGTRAHGHTRIDTTARPCDDFIVQYVGSLDARAHTRYELRYVRLWHRVRDRLRRDAPLVVFEGDVRSLRDSAISA